MLPLIIFFRGFSDTASIDAKFLAVFDSIACSIGNGSPVEPPANILTKPWTKEYEENATLHGTGHKLFLCLLRQSSARRLTSLLLAPPKNPLFLPLPQLQSSKSSWPPEPQPALLIQRLPIPSTVTVLLSKLRPFILPT